MNAQPNSKPNEEPVTDTAETIDAATAVGPDERTELTTEEIEKAVEQALNAMPKEPEPAERVAQLEQELAQMRDQLMRQAAETENVRKRAERDIKESSKYAVTGFARDLVNVVENLNLALINIPGEARQTDERLDTLAKGVEMTQQELLRVLEKHGISRIQPQGEKFNHNLHEAVAQVEDPKAEPGTVIQVLQAGYIIQDRLLRPAMVVVAKSGDPSQKIDTQA